MVKKLFLPRVYGKSEAAGQERASKAVKALRRKGLSKE
jgi:hypothetical protein